MSDPAKKVKKVKEEKIIDYSKMPDDIWEKELKAFMDLCNDIEIHLNWAGRRLDRLQKCMHDAK